MGIIPEDNIEKDSVHLLVGRLSKIANNPNHHSADQARKLHDKWSFLQTQPLPKSPTEKQESEAQVLALRKRIELFLKQN
jgi:hypothetical protein